MLKNTYPDCRAVVFDEKYHTYTIAGVKYTSVSKVIDHFKPPFDPTGEILAASAKKQGKTPEALKAEWQAKGKKSTERGTAMHQIIEDHIAELIGPEDTIPFNNIEWLEKVIECIKPLHSGNYTGIHCEQVVATDPDLHICGTADLLVEVETPEGEKQLCIYDYKTNEKFDTYPYDGVEKMLGSAGEFGLLDCHAGHYTLQMSIYAYCLRLRGCDVFNKAIIIHIDHDNNVTRIPLDLLPQAGVHGLLLEFRNATETKLATRPEDVAREMKIGLPEGFGYSKADFARLADLLFDGSVGGGFEEPLAAYIKAQGVISVLELLCDRIKPEAISAADALHPQDRKRLGVDVSLRDTGRWSYPEIAAVKDAKEEIKRVEKLMKDAASNGLAEIPDPNTGELVPAASKTSSQTIALSFPKA
jgi:hypothetical protein